jgi:hypothetical protein
MKGIWFFGLSGSGKSFASKFIKRKIKNSIIIDGDQIRKYISYDLGYTKKDRENQIKRISGLAKILVRQDFFLIISTVYFNKKISKICSKLKILPVRIIRKNFSKIKNKHKTYKNKKNVVGKDIFYEKITSKIVINNGDIKFCKKLDLLIR